MASFEVDQSILSNFHATVRLSLFSVLYPLAYPQIFRSFAVAYLALIQFTPWFRLCVHNFTEGSLLFLISRFLHCIEIIYENFTLLKSSWLNQLVILVSRGYYRWSETLLSGNRLVKFQVAENILWDCKKTGKHIEKWFQSSYRLLSSAHDSTDFVPKAISFIEYTCEKDLDIF